MTDRDLEIYEFLKSISIATTTQLHKAFFKGCSKTVVCRRLKHLIDYKYINRVKLRDYFNLYGYSEMPLGIGVELYRKKIVQLSDNTHLYYVGEIPHPKLLLHELIGSEFLCELRSLNFSYDCIKRNSKDSIIIPDIQIDLTDGSVLFIEIQNTSNPIKNCTDKYIPYFTNDLWENNFTTKPKVIIVSKESNELIEKLGFTWINIYDIDVVDFVEKNNIQRDNKVKPCPKDSTRITLKNNITGKTYRFNSLMDANLFLVKNNGFLEEKLFINNEYSIEKLDKHPIN